MSNITMSIEESLLKKARKIAIERNSSLNSMVREYLHDLVASEEMHRELAVRELRELYNSGGAVVGEVRVSRDALHER